MPVPRKSSGRSRSSKARWSSRSEFGIPNSGFGIQRSSDATPSAVLAAALEERSRTVLRHLAALQRRRTAETVHDLRVASRRLVAVIDLLLPALEEPELVRLRKRLKRTLKDFNALRDLEIQRSAVAGLARRHAVLRPLLRSLRAGERAQLMQTRRRPPRLDRSQLEAAAAHVLEALQAPLKWPSGEAALLESARAVHASSYLALLRTRTHLNRDVPRSLHRLRIALKRTRYAAEILRPFLPGLRRKDLKAMNALQLAFGAVQDWTVVNRCIQKYARTGNPPGPMLPVLQELNNQRTALIDAALTELSHIDTFWPH